MVTSAPDHVKLLKVTSKDIKIAELPTLPGVYHDKVDEMLTTGGWTSGMTWQERILGARVYNADCHLQCPNESSISNSDGFNYLLQAPAPLPTCGSLQSVSALAFCIALVLLLHLVPSP